MQTARHAHVSRQLSAPNLSEIVGLQRQIARPLHFAQWLPALAFHHPADPAGRGLEGMRARKGTRSEIMLMGWVSCSNQTHNLKPLKSALQIVRHICQASYNSKCHCYPLSPNSACDRNSSANPFCLTAHRPCTR